MKIVIAPDARLDIAQQLFYLIEHDAAAAARRLEQRLLLFIELTLAEHPRAGAFIGHRGLWEIWIPRTRLIVWYRFTDDELQIVRVWHTSQDRDTQ